MRFMLPNDYSVLGDIFIKGILAYIAIIFIIRISGKRSLSKLNSFDFIITISLGSILSGVMTNPDLSLLEAMFAFSLMITLQYIVTFIAVRSDKFADWVKFKPALLYYDGRFNYQAMKKERITEKELYEKARTENYSSFDEVFAIVLESEGTISVVDRNEHTPESEAKSTLENTHVQGQD